MIDQKTGKKIITIKSAAPYCGAKPFPPEEWVLNNKQFPFKKQLEDGSWWQATRAEYNEFQNEQKSAGE